MVRENDSYTFRNSATSNSLLIYRYVLAYEVFVIIKLAIFQFKIIPKILKNHCADFF